MYHNSKSPLREQGAVHNENDLNSPLCKNYSTLNEKTQIFVNGKTVGYVQGNTFYKTLHVSRHFLRKPPAIAFDISTLLDARDNGAENVKVKDLETGISYIASIAHIFHKGKEFNRGWGNQIYLTFNGWVRQGNGLPVQISLFAGAR